MATNPTTEQIKHMYKDSIVKLTHKKKGNKKAAVAQNFWNNSSNIAQVLPKKTNKEVIAEEMPTAVVNFILFYFYYVLFSFSLKSGGQKNSVAFTSEKLIRKLTSFHGSLGCNTTNCYCHEDCL